MGRLFKVIFSKWGMGCVGHGMTFILWKHDWKVDNMFHYCVVGRINTYLCHGITEEDASFIDVGIWQARSHRISFSSILFNDSLELYGPPSLLMLTLNVSIFERITKIKLTNIELSRFKYILNIRSIKTFIRGYV